MLEHALQYTAGIAKNYYQLLPYTFRRFSILSARRTLLPTLRYYLTRASLPVGIKPALCTMNILPPMIHVWYHFARKNLGDGVDIVIFDCSGKLKKRDFPHALVLPFLNFYAATKCDEFLYHIARNRRIGWICDDDMFPMSPKMLTILDREFADPNTASVSFRPRDWWHYEIEGKSHTVSSSYCTAINRDIFVKKERLSLAPADSNDHPSDIGKLPGRYDTFDLANEVLLKKGYRCAIVSEEERKECLTGFSGMSGAVMLLNYFKTSEQVIDYYLSPPKQQWSGNVLFGTLSAMLAVCTIQELSERITGKHYPLPSLPSRRELEKIAADHKLFLRNGQSFAWIEEASERLRAAL
ncbi:MAG: hypothetical protein Q7R81_01390 [Candidatus Peregrinibacteria bacterium]|nr:hypothetical protein [Candidatus Peregrinibacteria bacterium]